MLEKYDKGYLANHTNYDGVSISSHRKNLNMNSFNLVNYVGLFDSDILIKAINNSMKYADSVGRFVSYKELKSGINRGEEV